MWVGCPIVLDLRIFAFIKATIWLKGQTFQGFLALSAAFPTICFKLDIYFIMGHYHIYMLQLLMLLHNHRLGITPQLLTAMESLI
jgi:hypothetical protein